MGTGVRRETEIVLVFTGDLELGGGIFGAVAHGHLVVHVKETVDDERVLGLKVAERGVLTGDKEAVVKMLACAYYLHIEMHCLYLRRIETYGA